MWRDTDEKDTWNIISEEAGFTLAQLLEASADFAARNTLAGEAAYCFVLGEAIVHLQKAGLPVQEALIKGLLATQVYCAAHPEEFKTDTGTFYHPPL